MWQHGVEVIVMVVAIGDGGPGVCCSTSFAHECFAPAHPFNCLHKYMTQALCQLLYKICQRRSLPGHVPYIIDCCVMWECDTNKSKHMKKNL